MKRIIAPQHNEIPSASESASKEITASELEAARKRLALAAVSGPKVTSSFKALVLLYDDVEKLIELGFSYKEIAGILAETGLIIKTENFRQYIYKIRQAKVAGEIPKSYTEERREKAPPLAKNVRQIHTPKY